MNQKLIKILLIEDNPDDALLIRKMLSEAYDEIMELNLKFELECVESLQEGIELLKKEKYNVILLDLLLPDSQGLDTVDKIHAEAPGVPVVVMTGLSDGQRGIKALGKGAQDYLIKGVVDKNLLVRSVCYAMERHQIKKEIENMREELVTVLTHDLKTPVTSIMGYADLLIDPEGGEIFGEKLEYIQNIRQSADLLLDSINNILETSRIEAGQMEITFDNFLLDDLLKELHNTFEPLTTEGKINLDFSCPKEMSVYADRDKIREVFHNLISNALRYTPKGGTISIKATPDSERVAIEVGDTGCGIAESKQGKLFQKFAQIEDKRHGTGLGLYIVKNFLKGHGSDIRLESAPGKGTRFFFNLAKANS